MEESFRSLYSKTYGYESGDQTEIVSVRLTAVGSLPQVELASQHVVGKDASPAIKSIRQVFFDGKYHDTRIYDDSKLKSGNSLEGPAIIERRESTVVVLPRQVASKDERGNILIGTVPR